MITPRLNSILKHITGKTIADIGTDHAYIPIYLSQNGLINHAIACDIKEGPLKIAEQNIKKYNLSDIIELRLGAGLNPLKNNETDSLAIAGMGGEMIINILGENTQKSHSFSEIILQPMNFQCELRKWLIQNDFEIICEDLACEGFKIYNIIKIKSGNTPEFKKELDYHLPEYLYKNPLFPMLVQKKKREFNKILTGLERAKNKNIPLIKNYSELLKELEKL